MNVLTPDYKQDQAILAFVRKRKLITKVKLNHLITDFSKLCRVDSGYHWGKYLGLNAAGRFVVEDLDGKKILFDASVGKHVEFKLDKAGKLQRWKMYQDIMRCYEFQ